MLITPRTFSFSALTRVVLAWLIIRGEIKRGSKGERVDGKKKAKGSGTAIRRIDRVGARIRVSFDVSAENKKRFD